MWGPVPLLNYFYASRTMHELGYNSKTVVSEVYANINNTSNFDINVGDFFKTNIKTLDLVLFHLLAKMYLGFLYSLINFDVFHHGCNGGFLGMTRLWRLEAFFYKLAGKKVIILAYGADTYALSKIQDISMRHCMQMSYPGIGAEDHKVISRNQYWQKNANTFICGSMLDYIWRWDLVPYNYITIDETIIIPKKVYSNHDGISGPVKVYHCPNHRGIKGTEFLLEAVDRLKNEGLKIELCLIQNMQNSELMNLLHTDADILAEQFILNAYGLNGIEGMATGLPVMANITMSYYNVMFRRYSFLNKCPVVPTSPENLYENLKTLVTNPKKRKELGLKGRDYIEEFHSKKAARYMYESIYKCIWYNEDIDLLNLFHPLKHYLKRNHR
ncbi:MAG: hypothetical protein COW01_04310 [Bdellovibrionales bacterium CG12_big_fil_rev_8_21_14_0_65_38_15]|nr:MAG: hypothetical protein COW79_06750 [Bdellovibrionales bacterium CG22_combo_CG10-13_8_21_14_all_38_13]PIQ56527.1 MAG: hypothetical protein COW01_04310 [Bdellovibrionales bacterium CG12_big_fil_rev_8_21_14_0_65_38_15]